MKLENETKRGRMGHRQPNPTQLSGYKKPHGS